MVSRSSLEVLATRAGQFLDQNNLATEEAAKHALVLPFIQALGYDVFDPGEVVPEYTADFGIRQNEKVDYAIVREEDDNEPAILNARKWTTLWMFARLVSWVVTSVRLQLISAS